jgi:hypothetical protein
VAVPRELEGAPEETRRVFELCVGQEFTVIGFDNFGHAELNVGELVDRVVGGFDNTIWVEPEYLEKVGLPD